MNELAVVPFYFQENEVRTVTIENEPWFVAADVCAVLEHSNTSVALSMLDDDEKGLRKVYTLGGEQEMLVISESGLYTLIIRSNKPQAKTFRKWVTAEVLPAIRKTGGYLMPGYAAITKDELYTLQAEVIDLYRKNTALMEEKIARLEYQPEKRAHRPLNDDEKEKIIEMVASGMSQRKVARTMHRSTATVSYLVSNRLREMQS